MEELEAVQIIQRAWRKHIDIQVFKYYRDLINFSSQGIPSRMLCCINPIEAKLLDEAAGIHVRFRLTGENFPPNVCYKIFTHRPIQDMCSNSPKDYTDPCSKKLEARFVNNKQTTIYGDDKNKIGWYNRDENNGWRLVSNRHLISRKISGEIFSGNKKHSFHHSRLQRKQDLQIKRKRRKIEWMKKLYQSGMLNLKENDDEINELVDEAAVGLIKTYTKEGEDGIQDWEVDELLNWTNGLNFDNYHSSWKHTGTSAASNQLTPELIDRYGAGGGDSSLGTSTNERFAVLDTKGDGDIRASSSRYAALRTASGNFTTSSTEAPNPSPRSDF